MTRLLPILLLWCVTASAQVFLPHRRAIAPPPNIDPLAWGLVAYWRMDESSGTRYDAVGTNHLALTYLDGQRSGKITNAALFQYTSPVYLDAPSNSDLQTGDIDFTCAGWVKVYGSTGAGQYLFGKVGDNADDYKKYEFIVFTTAAGTQVGTDVSDGVSHDGSPATVSISTNTWTYVLMWHDHTANTVNLQVNDGSVQSVSYTFGSWTSTNDFRIGGRTTRNAWASVDEVGFWKRVLTAGERSALYNSGSGLTYPFTGNDALATNALIAYWRLDETNGTRVSAIGTNSLYWHVDTPIDSVSGRITNSAFFTPNTQVLEAADSPELSMAATDFTVMAWVKIAGFTTDGTQQFVAKASPFIFTTADYEWVVGIGEGTNSAQKFPHWTVSDGTTHEVHATNSATMTTNVWHQMIGWYDKNAQTVNLQYDNGTVNSQSDTFGCWDSPFPVVVGGNLTDPTVAPPEPVWGSVDEVAVWRRVLTSGERDRLWNSGNGLPYPFH